MALSDDLRSSVGGLWERTVTHPFVLELGEGTLPADKWDVYFRQDYLFLKPWIALMCAGVVKAPDFDHARPLAAFVHGALGAEEGMFRDYFREKGLSAADVADLQYLPTSHAQNGFLRQVARDGSFHEILTTLLGIEWPYLDWAQRLDAAGKRPANRHYQLWIDIHAGKELGDFVAWLRSTLDGARIGHGAHLERTFLATLRYEYMFWEMAYKGEAWPE